MPTHALTQQNFDQTIARGGIVLVDFWAGWCGWCSRFAPIYEESSNLHPEILHATVDTEAEQALTAAAQIASLPTLMGFREGLLVYTKPGFQTSAELEDVVQSIQWMDMDEVRRERAAQQPQGVTPQGPATPPRAAGLASGPARYGWPGLQTR
ncbi:thioredoxin family protein [Nocardia blacklockiae]|uniref:thioredoxin family protein n=1 Tax=Nocardia blacklockiae TaxID=480036 RepID=UPI00189412DD|nr:thioredoxin domain-containing protein [Nocardia blacklockiae]MBF6172208.1 thiol reductase thioredoxin [Nocardia blacklockiae]